MKAEVEKKFELKMTIKRENISLQSLKVNVLMSPNLAIKIHFLNYTIKKLPGDENS